MLGRHGHRRAHASLLLQDEPQAFPMGWTNKSKSRYHWQAAEVPHRERFLRPSRCETARQPDTAASSRRGEPGPRNQVPHLPNRSRARRPQHHESQRCVLAVCNSSAEVRERRQYREGGGRGHPDRLQLRHEGGESRERSRASIGSRIASLISVVTPAAFLCVLSRPQITQKNIVATKSQLPAIVLVGDCTMETHPARAGLGEVGSRLRYLRQGRLGRSKSVYQSCGVGRRCSQPRLQQVPVATARSHVRSAGHRCESGLHAGMSARRVIARSAPVTTGDLVSLEEWCAMQRC